MSEPKTTHNFYDGRGPVPAHRHINPDGSEGGWVDDTASVGEGAWVGEGDTKPDFASIMAEFRVKRPEVPIVRMLDTQILGLVTSNPKALEMIDVHTCETTHCRAGWAIHLAGPAGYELEKKLGWCAAGGAIYRASTGRWPDFYAPNVTALEDIKRGAEEEAATGGGST